MSLEDIFGDASRDGAVGDEIKELAHVIGRDRAVGDVEPFGVEHAEQVLGHPVGCHLGIAALGPRVSKYSAVRREATSTPAS